MADDDTVVSRALAELHRAGGVVLIDFEYTCWADSLSTQNGELALGQNVLCAFMSWNGYNFEDAIILSEELVRDDRYTSIHLETHEVEARDTKLGPEEITRDLPNVGDEALRDLDERGIIRVGAMVGPGDLLVR